jgi:hypothetical protein
MTTEPRISTSTQTRSVIDAVRKNSFVLDWTSNPKQSNRKSFSISSTHNESEPNSQVPNELDNAMQSFEKSVKYEMKRTRVALEKYEDAILRSGNGNVPANNDSEKILKAVESLQNQINQLKTNRTLSFSGERPDIKKTHPM